MGINDNEIEFMDRPGLPGDAAERWDPDAVLNDISTIGDELYNSVFEPSEDSMRVGSVDDEFNAELYAGTSTRSNSLMEEEYSVAQATDIESAPRQQPVLSRTELLDIVRKHSENLLKPIEWITSSQRPVDGALMEPRYWQEILDMFFVRGWSQGQTSLDFNHGALFDDMLFFVRTLEEKSAMASIPEEGTAHDKRPFFVRRWGNNLSAVVGVSSMEVDWRQSFYLNLICHSSFTLTMATCSRQALEHFKRNPRGPPVKPLKKVTKRVYASPSIARLDWGPPQADASGFPNIYFSVDDLDDALEPMDLNDPDYCLCVMLNAHGGAAFPIEDQNWVNQSQTLVNGNMRRSSTQVQAFGEDIDGTPKVTLFSGFVNYGMVRNSFQGGPAGALFQPNPSSPERLVMKGPGGQGEADVTVWAVADEPPMKRNRVAQRGPPPAPSPAPPPAQFYPPPAPSPASPPAQFYPPPAPPAPSGLRLRELQGQLVRVREQLLQLVKFQQSLAGRRDLSLEQKTAEEKRCGQQLLLLHEELRLVQKRLQQIKTVQGPSQGTPLGTPQGTGRGTVPGTPQGSQQGGLTEYVRKTVVQATVPVLRCSLRSLCVPWDALAYDLLFKGVPMKVDISGHVRNRHMSREAARRVPEPY